MTILSVCQEVAKVVGLEEPDVVFSSATREIEELRSVANEMARRIADVYDWQALCKIATITGDGATEDWSLPSDYLRQMKKTHLWSSSLETALSHIKDLDRWLELDVQSFDFIINAWTIYGGEIHVKPALASAVTAKYFYVRNTVVTANGGSLKTSFTADDDTYGLSEDLLKLGIIWRWKEYKGQDYAEAMQDYEELKERLIIADKGSKGIRVGRPRLPSDVKIAYPVSITA
jgi:hypothetical protein